MNTTGTISTIKIDKQTKQQAQEIAQNLGTTLQSVINQLLKQFISTKGKDYTKVQKKDLTPSPYLQTIIKEADKDRTHDSPTFTTGEESEFAQFVGIPDSASLAGMTKMEPINLSVEHFLKLL